MLGRLAWRWPIAVAAAIFLAANLVGITVAIRAGTAVRRAVEERAVAIARGVEHRCHDDVLARDAAGVRRCLQGLWEEPGVYRVAVVGADGSLVAEARPHSSRGHPLTVRYAAADGAGDVQAFVVVDLDERATERAVDAARREALGAALAFALVGVALAVLATRRLVRPLRVLAAAEAAIAAGDRTARVPIEGPEETRTLASAFNTMAAAVRDRDERLQRRGDELQAALERAHDLEREKRSLTAMVVHDLRGPIGAVRSALDVIDAANLPATDRDMLATSAQRLDAALAMATDLLDISRLEQAAQPLARTEVDLVALCRRLAAARWADGGGRAVPIILDTDAETLPASVDPRLVERAISNLLANAVRHAGGEAPIRLEVTRSDAAVRIAVEDQGPGVPAAERARIFLPFERGAGPRAEGAGLGLALCARVAAAHAGRVEVKDGRSGRGARFVLELPTEPA